MYRKTVLPNGLRVVTHDIKNRESVSLGLWVGVGGRYEEGRMKGAAHFLEHMVFKGSRQYGCDEIKERIEGIGGALNAFTCEEQTCFYAKIPNKHLSSTFDVLADMVFFPKLALKDLTKEKTVIVEEIKMYNDLPQYFVMELLDELVWGAHPLGKSLAGTPETVNAMTPKDLKQFHAQHYNPANVVVCACGRLDHQALVVMVQDRLGDLAAKECVPYLPVEKFQEGPRFKIHKKNIEQTHVVLGVPGLHEQHPDRFALSMLSTILGGNMSSRLFVQVREKRGLAYSIGCSSKNLHDTGLFMIRAGVDNQKLVEAFSVILKELRKVKRTLVSEGEFTRARDYLMGQLLLGLEDTMDHMLWLGEAVVAKDRMKTLKKVIQAFEAVTREDICRVARQLLHEHYFNLALVGPVISAQELELKELLGIG